VRTTILLLAFLAACSSSVAESPRTVPRRVEPRAREVPPRAGQCMPERRRPRCAEAQQIPVALRGVWEAGDGRQLLVDACGVYAAAWWFTAPECLLTERAVDTYRWAVDFVSDEGFIVSLCGRQHSFRNGAAGEDLESDGDLLRRVSGEGGCHRVETERYGIELRTPEDFEWSRSTGSEKMCGR
jgi:hypothetical protein